MDIGRGVITAILRLSRVGRLFLFVTIIVKCGTIRVVCTCGGRSGSSSNIPVESLTTSSSEHEKHECEDTGGQCQSDNNKHSRDSTGIVEKVVGLSISVRRVERSSWLVNDLSHRVDFSCAIRRDRSLGENFGSCGDDSSGTIGGGNVNGRCEL